MQTPVSKEVLEELRELIQQEVAAGYLPEDEIAEFSAEVVAGEYEEEILLPHAEELTRELLEAHEADQATWPEITDCDRLEAAFLDLERSGVVCRQNYSCCGTCGAAEIRSEMDALDVDGTAIRGYAFFHMQDTENVVQDGVVCLSYGAREEDETAAVSIGREIEAALEKQGLPVAWDGTWSKRLCVKLRWQRRR